MSLWFRSNTFFIFFIALFMRLCSVAISTLTNINPYTQADAGGFANSAQRIASGSLSSLNLGSIYDFWGLILSPLWIIPGPSRIYGRIVMAILGAIAVYNVYLLARYLHSQQAGIIAVLPMMFFPSFLFLHSSIVREAMVLFAMTTIARLLLIPEVRINKRSRILSIAILFYILHGLRPENIIIYTLILLSIIIADRKPWQNYELISISLAIASISTSLGILIRYSELIINEIAIVRNWRGRGRTAYLDWFIPDTIFEMIAFSWIGAVYFLYSPFPWMIHSILDLPILIEAVVNIVYSCAAVAGIRVISAENSTVAVGFITGIVAGLMMYSLGTVNVGTAVKHRPMFLWAIFLLGGIGISNYIRIHGIKPQS